MKSERRRAAILGVSAIACLLAGGATPAFAVRAERGVANEVRRAPARPLPARERSVDQAAAATEALKAGLRVSWDDEQGTPRRVRGAGLDRHAGLSSGAPSNASANAGDQGRAHAVLAGVGRLFGFRDVSKEFKSRSSRRDELGFRHVRMMQLHDGLRVVGGELIAHFDAAGNAYEVNGRYVTGLDAVGAARLTPDAAVRAAAGDQERLGLKPAKAVRKPELVVFAVGQAPALAYEISMRTDMPGARGVWRYWIDARSGDVLLGYNDLRTIGAPSTNGVSTPITGIMLAGEGGGVTNVTGWYENTNGCYYLHATQLWWQVYNVASGGYIDKSTYAYRSSNNWAATDAAEVSLAHAFEKIQRYHFSMFGLQSFSGTGTMARANAHEGTDYVNAFWDSDTQAFYFGDGDGVEANCLAVVDVAGHEFGHALDEHSAGLIYSYESGQLNESFADIAGVGVEFFAQPDGRSVYPSNIAGHADWLIGEDCWLSSTALRDMRSPTNTATVGTGGEQPSRYHGSYWYYGSGDNGGVHYNSGVQNFVFYLIAEGGTGNNDGLSYSLTGIGVSNAARIAYRTLTAYCTPATDHAAVRDAWMSAAEDLNPAWLATVDAAWNAVGLGKMALVSTRGLSAAGPVGGPFAPMSRICTVTNCGVMSLDWTVTHTQSWVDVSPSGGTLSGGKTTNVSVALNSGVNALGQGVYTDAIVFSNTASGNRISVGVTVRIGVKDDVTELFSSYDNDLNGVMLTFKPDTVTTSYTVMVESITNYPTDPKVGTLLSMSDDSFSSKQSILYGKRVRLFGVEYDGFYVGSNGYITFGEGDSDPAESFVSHFDLPRISALFDDLNPTGSSKISWKQTNGADRVAVTYDNVPEYGSTVSNRIQVEMFFDGTIRIAYLKLVATDGLVGLSPGGGVPAGFAESDLNAYGSPPLLRVTPPSINFGSIQAGTSAEAVFTVTNAGDNVLQGTATVAGVFSIASGASYYLSPGTTHAVRVRYSPPSAGTHSNNVTFTDGGGATRAAMGRAIGNGDTDGDGATDWEEYLAGTATNNPLDYFRIGDALTVTNGVVIRWNGATGRWYTVSATTNLTGTWTDVYGAAGIGGEMSYTNPPSGAQMDFLRVRARLDQ